MTAASSPVPRPVALRTRTNDGPVAWVRASKVPKSLSAETTTRLVSTSEGEHRGIIGAAHALVTDVHDIVTHVSEQSYELGRKVVVEEQPHALGRSGS